MARRLPSILSALVLGAASLTLAAVWAGSHALRHNTYAAMSHPWSARYEPPQDTGLHLVPGAFYVMADQRVGAPPPVGPIPYWPLVLATAAWPAWCVASSARRRLRRRRAAARAAGGRCRSCGYDLRATPEQCPECGLDTPVEGRVL